MLLAGEGLLLGRTWVYVVTAGVVSREARVTPAAGLLCLSAAECLSSVD